MIAIDEILQLVGLQLGKRGVKADDRIVEDLGAESADIANIVASLEEKYAIIITEPEIAGIRTVRDLYAIVNTHLAA
jgi:acyl carrier protein